MTQYNRNEYPKINFHDGLSLLKRHATNKLCVLVPLVASLIAASYGSAQTTDQSDVPPGCYLFCKEQYNLISSYSNFTTAQSLKNTFGDPVEIAEGQKYVITKYSGDAIDFFTLDSIKPINRLGVAIYVKGDPKHARIPYLHMGSGGQSGGVRWMFTANDYPLKYIIEECPGAIGIDARHAYAWLPKCYFGRPGSYMNYSFLYSLSGDDCINFEYTDAKQLATCNSDLKPVAIFVSSNEEIQSLADAISSFIYWDEVE